MRKAKRSGILLLVLLLLLCPACGERQESETLQLWFPTDLGQSGVQSRAVSGVPYTGAADVNSMMKALLNGPEGGDLRDPFPNGTRLLGSILSEGVLHLDLSSSYGDLTGIDLTLADYCIALTMCQLEGVEQVYITVSGNEIAYRSRQYLSGEDVIFTGAEDEPRQVAAVLYFPRRQGSGLGFEVRQLTLTEDDGLYRELTRAVMEGPKNSGLCSLMPEETQLLDVRVENGICYVNVSAHFVTDAPEHGQEQTQLLYSLVNTLGNLDTVTAVQILVEDELLTQYGDVSMEQPLEPDFRLVGSGG